MTKAPLPTSRRALPLRIFGFLLFLIYFFRALLIANLQLARTVLFEKSEDLSPGFLNYSVDELTKLEILLLSHCITLTPGTTTVEISEDFKELLVHALDARDPRATAQSIRDELELPLLRWTR